MLDNIKGLIDERLWNEIKRNYLGEQYSNAVLDAVQFLGDLIREMSGEDGDGYSLIGTVFNTKNPKIKVNHLRTQTDKDIQSGIMLLLQGFYRAIRNERVHEKKIDTEQDAYEIILFVNHIIRIIDKSKGKFTIENTIRRVFDDNFLPREDYVKHIVKMIPATKKFEVAVEVLRNREESKNKTDLAVFWNLLKIDLKKDEIKNIRDEISESLRYADTNNEITSIVFIVGEDWQNLDHDARLRAENTLIRNLPDFLSDGSRGGPTSKEFIHISKALFYLYNDDMMELKTEFAERVFSLLLNESYLLTEFLINSFGEILRSLDSQTKSYELEKIIIRKLKGGSKIFESYVKRYYSESASEMIAHMPIDFDDMDDELPF